MGEESDPDVERLRMLLKGRAARHRQWEREHPDEAARLRAAWKLDSFIWQNESELLPTHLDGNILLEFLDKGPFCLRVNITDETSPADWKKAWSYIAEWRRRYIREFGRNTWIEPNAFFARLQKYSDAGLTKREIADYVNEEVVHELIVYRSDWASDHENEAFSSHLKSIDDVRSLLLIEPKNPPWDSGLRRAKEMLVYMGLPDGKAEEWLWEILCRVAAGEEPFLCDGGPVEVPHVENRLRAWKKRRKRQAHR